jgi:hypothetical protein
MTRQSKERQGKIRPDQTRQDKATTKELQDKTTIRDNKIKIGEDGSWNTKDSIRFDKIHKRLDKIR